MSAIPLLRKPPLAIAPENGERVDIPFLDCGPEIAMALGSGSAAFQDVVLAYFFGREDAAGENTLECTRADRAVLRDNFNTLLRYFEAKHGRIERSYFARHCLAAAALTCNDEIEVVLARDVPSSELIQVIRRAQSLGYQAWHRLERRDRSLCQRMIFSVILEVLRRLDLSREAGNHDAKLSVKELVCLNRNLEEAEDFMLRCATRRAQTEYLRGMLDRGSVLLLVLLMIAGTTWLVNESYTSVFGQAVLAAIAGGVGATVSVMWRMTSGTFSINLPTLEYDSARSQLRVMGGASRPSGVARATRRRREAGGQATAGRIAARPGEALAAAHEHVLRKALAEAGEEAERDQEERIAASGVVERQNRAHREHEDGQREDRADRRP